ncbi:MAG: 3'(2'),5'-bisphosphate nucleotidase [Puniceicoccaceae bacterium]|nr:MAG: 3'(2'),5'-bisphosphate nucleotidase [Puniceicoccaceae bacterium]
MPLSPLFDPLLEIGRIAGDVILSHYGRPIEVELKADDSPLTLADRDSHRAIVGFLHDAFPDVPVISEESDPGDPTHDHAGPRFWLVDPLDGTKEFLKNTGYFTVNIALIEEGRPVAGLIHTPVHGLTYFADRAMGIALKIEAGGDPRPIHSAEPSGDHLRFVASRDHAGPQVRKLLAAFPDSECLSIGSSLKFCLVAEGAADAYLRDVPTMEWDTAAAQAIVETAGGAVLTVPAANPLRYGKPELRNPSLLTVGRSSLAPRLLAVL